LVEQVLEIDAAALEGGGFGIGEIVGDDIDRRGESRNPVAAE